MIDYVFRGQKEDGSFAVGSLIYFGWKPFIYQSYGDEKFCEDNLCAVDEDTVSPWTMVWAKDNKRLFVGDKVEFNYGYSKQKYNGEVQTHNGSYYIKVNVVGKCYNYCEFLELDKCSNITIIGNIYERGK